MTMAEVPVGSVQDNFLCPESIGGMRIAISGDAHVLMTSDHLVGIQLSPLWISRGHVGAVMPAGTQQERNARSASSRAGTLTAIDNERRASLAS